MPNFEKLLMAVTRNGQLTPTDFRKWAHHYARELGVSTATMWLEELADTLEEIYAEVIEKYKEE